MATAGACRSIRGTMPLVKAKYPSSRRICRATCTAPRYETFTGTSLTDDDADGRFAALLLLLSAAVDDDGDDGDTLLGLLLFANIFVTRTGVRGLGQGSRF
jgi:hypothetical protein